MNPTSLIRRKRDGGQGSGRHPHHRERRTGHPGHLGRGRIRRSRDVLRGGGAGERCRVTRSVSDVDRDGGVRPDDRRLPPEGVVAGDRQGHGRGRRQAFGS